MSNLRPVVVNLLSDFGTDEIFSAEVEAEICGRLGSVRVLHVTHAIRPHDVCHAAFTIAQWFNRVAQPDGVTVCLADPQSSCPIVVCKIGAHRLVAPDNGCLTLIADRLTEIVEASISADHWGQCGTFRGRDVMPQIVADVIRGTLPGKARPISRGVYRLQGVEAIGAGQGKIIGTILHIDHFGNAVSNVPNDWVSESHWKCQVDDHVIECWESAYQSGRGRHAYLIHGSSGFVEISLSGDRAADFLGIGINTRVVFSSPGRSGK